VLDEFLLAECPRDEAALVDAAFDVDDDRILELRLGEPHRLYLRRPAAS
jgi:hypothetical protein